LLPRLRVVSRALPTDKSRLVKIAKNCGHVVGMTGDGINDSAALRSSDVGFSMGSGSDVAKEASDIVILDDNFSSISQAVLYGRTIFRSIRKFIVFQSTVNLASTVIVFMGPILGFDFPLSLIQLLWVNLVMDTLAAIAFGGEPALPSFMKSAPVHRESKIISPEMWSAIIFNGGFIAIFSIIFLTYSPIQQLFLRNDIVDQKVFLTAFFCFFIFITNFNSLNVRTKGIHIFENILENINFIIVGITIFCVQIIFTYIGGSWLRTVGLNFKEWVIIILMSATIIPFDMIRKLTIVPRLITLTRVETKEY